MQVDRRSQQVRDCRGGAREIRRGAGLHPGLPRPGRRRADGYPGIRGIGRVGAARLIARYGPLEDFPPQALGEQRALALLFKDLATLRSDAALFSRVDELRWAGPSAHFAAMAEQLGEPKLLARATRAAAAR